MIAPFSKALVVDGGVNVSIAVQESQSGASVTAKWTTDEAFPMGCSRSVVIDNFIKEAYRARDEYEGTVYEQQLRMLSSSVFDGVVESLRPLYGKPQYPIRIVSLQVVGECLWMTEKDRRYLAKVETDIRKRILKENGSDGA